MSLRVGQVIVSEVNRQNPWSRAIAHITGSKATHALIYVGRGKAIEASWPQVRWVDVESKMQGWQAQDQAYVVLDLPGISLYQRANVAWQTIQFVGRIYDVGQLVIFAVTGKFWHDGPGTQVCSRLVTAAFDGTDDLFDAATLAKNYPADFRRLDNLRSGQVTPGDLLKSKLEVVAFTPSSAVRDVADFHKP